jgi:hypothetical protein
MPGAAGAWLGARAAGRAKPAVATVDARPAPSPRVAVAAASVAASVSLPRARPGARRRLGGAAPASRRHWPEVVAFLRRRLRPESDSARVWAPARNRKGAHRWPARAGPEGAHRHPPRAAGLPDHDRSAVDPLRSTSSSQIHVPGLTCERIKTKPPDVSAQRRPAPPRPLLMVADFFRAAHNFCSRIAGHVVQRDAAWPRGPQ